ncbi:MAG: hypothetical protein HY432_00835 [Candidatus Liptonbacteria bacterium]|nr:hypothetical protein [Candidatus Liptonbacteria bacterium]
MGLLHGGKDVAPFAREAAFSDEKKSQSVGQWVRFYIQEGGNLNAKVARTAQQVLVQHWFRHLDPEKMMYPGYLAAAREALEFLKEPKFGIYDPPYPRFVSEWLLALHKEWECGCRPDYQGGDAARRTLQSSPGFDELLIGALCAWGLAYVLGKKNSRPGVLRHIENFLEERHYSAVDALMQISGTGEPLSHLNSRAVEDDINRVAAYAFIKLLLQTKGRIVVKVGTDTGLGVGTADEIS